jgi:hypothetical protein
MKSCNSKVLSSRRTLLRGALVGMYASALIAVGAMPLGAQAQAPKGGPVTLNIVDVAGNLALTQDAIELFQKKHPELIAKINFTKAPAPELPGKLKAMQGAGRSDIDLVMTGTDFLAAGIEQGVLMKMLPDNAAKFPNLVANYQPAAAKMQELAQDYGVAVVFMPRARSWSTTRTRSNNSHNAGRPAGVVQGKSQQADLRSASELRAGAYFHHGSALHPGRFKSEGSGQGLGQDLGVSEGTQQLYRVLPDRHRCGHEGTGRRLA